MTQLSAQNLFIETANHHDDDIYANTPNSTKQGYRSCKNFGNGFIDLKSLSNNLKSKCEVILVSL